jgi:PAS domain S-box-containing protein
VNEFASKILDTDFSPLWDDRAWTVGHLWLHVVADIVAGAASALLAAALTFVLVRRHRPPFATAGWLLVVASVCSAGVHLTDASLFWWPCYRLTGVSKALAAASVSGAAIAAWWSVRKVLSMPNATRMNELLQIEIRERERANERLRLVVELAPNAIVIANQNGRIAQVNAQAERYFGYERSELVGQSVDVIVPERMRRGRPGDPFAARVEGPSPAASVDRQLNGLRKDGSEFPIDVGVQPVVTDRNVMMLVAVSDMTAQKASEAALERLADELRQSNTELAQFAYVASHDLKEPLRKVASFCQLLKERYRGKLDADGERYIEYAVDGTRRMQALITALLELSQVGSRDRPLSAVDSTSACDVALENLRTAIDECGADVARGALPVVVGDETQLVQLFQNLVGNAIKFRGPRPSEVRIDAVRRDGEWSFSVRDNGIGIDPTQRDRVFGIFQRLHTREEYPGTGIGLAICKKIVERAGGRIWIESAPGEGTTFQFTMPSPPEQESPSRRRSEALAHAY